jgi:hypothetical protein
MPKIVLIEKSGSLKTLNVKEFSETTLYKKAGLKNGDGFVLQHTWGAEDGLDQSIQLYAKKNGKAGQENKYDFPPPVDKVLFFGPCILVGNDLNSGKVLDLDEDDWEELYEYLFGGFEDLGSEDSDDDESDVETDDELDAIQKTTGVIVKQTKQGYAKDGFIVDDDEDDEYADNETDESSDDDSEESEPIAKRKRTATSKGSKTTTTKAQTTKKAPTTTKATNEKALPTTKGQNLVIVPLVQTERDLQLDDCESELSEESYD